MTDQVNIISICCTVFFDINEHSKKSGSDQIGFKNNADNIISIAFKYIGQSNRIILIHRNGAAIAYMGSPDDAMLMAMDIRNQILIVNKLDSTPSTICIGIHLEPVRLVTDFNEQFCTVSDCIRAAKRLMRRAKPNEILVSRAYYENTAPSTQQISIVFNSACLKHENHVLEYDAHQVNLNKNLIPVFNQPLSLDHQKMLTENHKQPESTKFLRAINKYAVACLLCLLALSALVKLAIAPESTAVVSPHKTVENLAQEKKLKTQNPNTLATKSNTTLVEESRNDKKAPIVEKLIQEAEQEKVQELVQESEQEKVTHKKSVQKNVKTNHVKKNVEQKPEKRIDTTAKNNKAKEIISWKVLKDSIRQGQKHECTQAEIALNQCD